MEITMRSPNDIETAAREFAAIMGAHKIFAFYGTMGAGKTTFIRAVCKTLGVMEEVTSPSFAIVNEYRSDVTGARFFHFDFYRIKKIEEVYDLGYEDYFYGNGTCFIEWPELIENLLPADAVKVTIEVQPDDSRKISF